MFTQTFKLIIFSAATIILLLAAYAVYCRNRAKAFANTGRLTDVETWAMKSTVSWIATFILLFGAVTSFIMQ